MAQVEGGGPVGALRRILATGLLAAQTRLQLIGNEILIEKHRAIQALVRVVLALFCLCAALALATVLLLLVLWDHRIVVLAVLVVAFLGAAVMLGRSVQRSYAEQEHPFAASVAELQDDLRQLKSAAQAQAHGSQKPR